MDKDKRASRLFGTRISSIFSNDHERKENRLVTRMTLLPALNTQRKPRGTDLRVNTSVSPVLRLGKPSAPARQSNGPSPLSRAPLSNKLPAALLSHTPVGPSSVRLLIPSDTPKESPLESKTDRSPEPSRLPEPGDHELQSVFSGRRLHRKPPPEVVADTEPRLEDIITSIEAEIGRLQHEGSQSSEPQTWLQRLEHSSAYETGSEGCQSAIIGRSDFEENESYDRDKSGAGAEVVHEDGPQASGKYGEPGKYGVEAYGDSGVYGDSGAYLGAAFEQQETRSRDSNEIAYSAYSAYGGGSHASLSDPDLRGVIVSKLPHTQSAPQALAPKSGMKEEAKPYIRSAPQSTSYPREAGQEFARDYGSHAHAQKTHTGQTHPGRENYVSTYYSDTSRDQDPMESGNASSASSAIDIAASDIAASDIAASEVLSSNIASFDSLSRSQSESRSHTRSETSDNAQSSDRQRQSGLSGFSSISEVSASGISISEASATNVSANSVVASGPSDFAFPSYSYPDELASPARIEARRALESPLHKRMLSVSSINSGFSVGHVNLATLKRSFTFRPGEGERSTYVHTLRRSAGTAYNDAGPGKWKLPTGIMPMDRKTMAINGRLGRLGTGVLPRMKKATGVELKHGHLQPRLLAAEVEEGEDTNRFGDLGRSSTHTNRAGITPTVIHKSSASIQSRLTPTTSVSSTPPVYASSDFVAGLNSPLVFGPIDAQSVRTKASTTSSVSSEGSAEEQIGDGFYQHPCYKNSEDETDTHSQLDEATGSDDDDANKPQLFLANPDTSSDDE